MNAPTSFAPHLAGDRSRAFLPHVHLLRALAILLVVGAHCWPDFAWTPTQRGWVLLVFDNVTVIFMFLSGLLFQHLSGRFAYRRYLAHRFSIVVLPYLIVSTPAVLAVVFWRHRDAVWPWVYALPPWQQIAVLLLTGKHLAPLWFMPMMALFILAAPLFVVIDRRIGYRWLLPATILLATLIGRDGVGGLATVLGKAVFMLPAYLAGMAFSRYRVAAEGWCARAAPALAGALGVVSAAILLGWTPGLDLSLIQKLLLTPLLLVGLARVPPSAVTRGAGTLAGMSFGIYFVHGYVITLFRIGWDRWTGLDDGAPPFAPSVPGLLLHVAAVALLSVALVAIVRRVLGARSRYVIGA